MRLPLNSLAMFAAMASCFVLAYFVQTAGSTFFTFPALIEDVVTYLCIGMGFVFMAMFVAALYDDMTATQEDGELE